MLKQRSLNQVKPSKSYVDRWGLIELGVAFVLQFYLIVQVVPFYKVMANLFVVP